MDSKILMGVALGALLVIGLFVGIATVSAMAGGGMMGMDMMGMGEMHAQCEQMMQEHAAHHQGSAHDHGAAGNNST